MTPPYIGIKLDPGSLGVVYKANGVTRIWRVDVRISKFASASKVEDIAFSLKANNSAYLTQISTSQLVRMLTRIRDGDETDPEDLSRLSEKELKHRKDMMSVNFQKNQILPGDPRYQYNKEVEFEPDDDGNDWDD